jgi:hypothetical protein
MDNREWQLLPYEAKIACTGMCGVKLSTKRRCTEPNRLNAKYCHSHRFTKRAKCSKIDCYNYSRSGKNGYCVKHGSSVINKLKCCIYCKKNIGRTKNDQCGDCMTVYNICKICKKPDSVPIAKRGGICKKCPLPLNLKCTLKHCTKYKLIGKNYCKSCENRIINK